MKTWHIFLLVAVIGIILYLVLRKNTIPTPVAAVAVSNTPAPGVSSTTGQVFSNTPAPPPPSVTATIQHAANPATPLQHIPVVGRAAYSVTTRVANAPTAIGNKINSSIEHIPVVGKALAAPGKVASKVVSYFNPLSW